MAILWTRRALTRCRTSSPQTSFLSTRPQRHTSMTAAQAIAKLEASETNTMAVLEEMRISKRIARAGLASRREAEAWISEGRVTLNGAVVTTPALNIGPLDKVSVDGRQLGTRVEVSRLWLCHKLRGELVTRDDPKRRPTLLGRLRTLGLRDTLKPVGRLDFNSEGLLLITNDGELARLLEHPASGILREYRVRVHGHVTEEKLRAIRGGPLIDEIRYKPIGCRIERSSGKNAWLVMTCTEGKNRQIRKICEHLRLDVNRLVRTRYGPFSLGQMRPGGVALADVKPAFFSGLRERVSDGRKTVK